MTQTKGFVPSIISVIVFFGALIIQVGFVAFVRVAQDLDITFVIAFVTFFSALDDFDEIKLCKIFVAKILALFVGLFVGVQIANINANKTTTWYVSQSSYAPASSIRFENLKRYYCKKGCYGSS